jgi:hypothetical protein
MEPEPQNTESTRSIPQLGGVQRIIESAVIAVATSTGLYLVGSVYTDAYFSRMSIEVTALDLAPPFIALQSAHVVQSLLEYPTTLLGFYVLYRLLSSRMGRLRSWYDRVRQRFGRVFLLIINLVIVSPLLAAAVRAGLNQGLNQGSTVLGDIAELMASFGIALLLYVIWLSFGPRDDILSQIRARKLIPIALIAALYLLDALIATANGAVQDAELLMTGSAESSIEIAFTLTAGVRDTLPDTALILVTARNGNYYVVERQDSPPSGRPVAYAVPFDSVDIARTRRINEAGLQLEDLMMEEFASPTPR